MKNKNLNLYLTLLFFIALVTCSREKADMPPEAVESGYIRISLSQDETKASLPAVDDFEVEIYNSRSVRLYRKNYNQAKDELIRLNAGDFLLRAHHGDSLGAGFNKPYYLAETPFTVHGFVDNGRKSDEVSAVAKLANVRVGVRFGENFPLFYDDYRAVVRHGRYAKKQVRFNKNELREAYMPGGELYLEVYASLKIDNKDTTLYFRSPSMEYMPNDAVSFLVNTGAIKGKLDLTIQVDRNAEDFVLENEIPSEALPAQEPYFSMGGNTEGEYSYSFPAGFAEEVSGQTLSVDISPKARFQSLVLKAEPSSLGIGEMDLLTLGDAEKTALESVGIEYFVSGNYPLAYVNFDRAVKYVSDNIPFDAAHPEAARFTLTVTDSYGQKESAAYSLVATPVNSTFSVKDTDIWGWKLVSPKARLTGVSKIPDGSVIGCQWSQDGVTWSSEIPSVSMDGGEVVFQDVTGLTSGKDVMLRTIVRHDPAQVSDPTTFKLEYPRQIGNNGFESYTTKKYTTPVILLSDWTVTWWQLWADEADAWWANNAMRSVEDEEVATGVAEKKTYPAVALFSSGAYSGKSVMLATIYTSTLAIASSLGAGTHHNTYGEIFLGKANDQCQENWKKISEGHSFDSRPASLSFRYKFNPYNSTPFYVLIEVLDSGGNVIARAEKNDIKSSASSWTRCTVGLNYTVTDRKAASIRLSFRSSKNGNEDFRLISVSTLSGSHDIFAGNILSLDNVELLYE